MLWGMRASVTSLQKSQKCFSTKEMRLFDLILIVILMCM